jgi:hypothetical protein
MTLPSQLRRDGGRIVPQSFSNAFNSMSRYQSFSRSAPSALCHPPFPANRLAPFDILKTQ